VEEKSGLEIFLEYMPALKISYKAILTAFYQLFVFILLIIIFWWISSRNLIGAGVYHFIISFLMILFFAYLLINTKKIRNKYREKYGKLAYQKLYYRYIIYQNVFGNASRYCTLILKTDYFLPAIITLPSGFLTSTFFPFYSAIPIGVFLFVIGMLLRRPSGGFDVDVDMYIYLIFPEKSRKVEAGIYNFIRHPRYLAECFMAVGIGVLANNLLAILFSFIHIVPILILIKIEDGELVRRFGDDFRKYQSNVPALIPKCKCWKKFMSCMFFRKNSYS